MCSKVPPTRRQAEQSRAAGVSARPGRTNYRAVDDARAALIEPALSAVGTRLDRHDLFSAKSAATSLPNLPISAPADAASVTSAAAQ